MPLRRSIILIAVLENNQLRMKVNSHGAELCSLVSRRTGQEWIWQPGPGEWQAHSPVLFPIIGGQKNGYYTHQGRSYQIPKHGFAMESSFACVSAGPGQMVFALRDNAQTRGAYPFSFLLEIRFSLHQSSVGVEYRLCNTGEEEMPYCIGGHTGYRVPFSDGQSFEEYELLFAQPETVSRHMLKDGMLEGQEPLLVNARLLPLSDALFQPGAVILKDLCSREVTLRSRYRGPWLRVAYPDFPYLGLWKFPGQRFVCIEPWVGCTSSAQDSQELTAKDGIRILAPGGEACHRHRITIGMEDE